jgi:hypothetical protein
LGLQQTSSERFDDGEFDDMIFMNLLRDLPPLVSRIARPWVTGENSQASSLRQPDGALLSPGTTTADFE